MCISVYVCVSVCMGPRPRRLTLKGSASCYYVSIIKKLNIYISEIEKQKILVWLLAFKPKNKYLVFCSRRDQLCPKNENE